MLSRRAVRRVAVRRVAVLAAFSLAIVAGCTDQSGERSTTGLTVSTDRLSIVRVGGAAGSRVMIDVAADVRRAPAPARHSTRLVFVGDSLAEEASSFLQYFTSSKAMVPKFWGGTAPCDWIDDDLSANRRTVVVISFTGNSLTPCMADGNGGFLDDQALIDRYLSDVTVLVERARRAGASVVLVGQPVRSGIFDDDDVVAGINEVYAVLAESLSSVAYVDAGAAVEGPGGTYVDHLPCNDLDTACDETGTAVVRGDGVHFCPVAAATPCPVWSSGAARFALAIAAAANDPRAFD